MARERTTAELEQMTADGIRKDITKPISKQELADTVNHAMQKGGFTRPGLLMDFFPELLQLNKNGFLNTTCHVDLRASK
jgi:hypothetical protein